MRQPVQVLIYPVRFRDKGWEYLLLRRVASRGGFWQGVTGGVEALKRCQRLLSGGGGDKVIR